MFELAPAFIYPDARAIADGVLVDITHDDIAIVFEGRPITRCSRTLYDAIEDIAGSDDPDCMWALLRFVLTDA